MHGRTQLLLLNAALAAFACDPPAEMDAGPRDASLDAGTTVEWALGPRLSGCVVGLAFADCGGDGPPVFACGQGCRWFTGGVAAFQHFVSNCPADDVCCHGGGLRAFAHEERRLEAASFFHTFGSEPWDAERASVIGVAVDETLARTPFAADCEGGTCEEPIPTRGFNRGTFFLSVRDRLLRGQVSLALEVFPDDRWARLCFLDLRDGVADDCGALARPPECATSGRLTLSRIPATDEEWDDTAVRLEARFEDGETVTMSF